MFGLGINRLGLAVRRIISALTQYAANGFEPELVLDFENDYYRVAGADTTFDNAVTFSRTGNATMVDSDGLIKWAPHNLLVDSENYSTDWNLAAGTFTGTITTGVSDPFGGTDAVTFTAGGNDSRFRGNNTVSASFTGEVTGEVWLRRRSGSSTVKWFPCGFANTDVTSTLTTSWQKFTDTRSVVASDNIIWQITLNSTDEVDVYYPRQYRSDLGGMVDNPDANPSDPSYVPTTGSARYLARRGHHVYNGTSWVNEGLLLESEARTNLFTYSEDFSQSYWNKLRSSIAPNATTAPDGTTTADKLVENTDNTFHTVFRSVTGTGVRTSSVYLKAGERSFANVGIAAGPSDDNTYAIVVDLSDGSITQTYTSGTATATTSVEDVGNGWFRVSLSGESNQYALLVYTATSGTYTAGPYGYQIYQGDGTSGIYIWGSQVEAAPTPSSYIPTNGATATRAGETVDVAAGDMPFSATGFSLRTTYTQPYWDVAGNVARTIISTTGTNGGSIFMQSREGQAPRAQFSGSVDGTRNSEVSQDGPDYSLALRMSSSEGQLAANGTSDATPITLTSGIGDTVSFDVGLFISFSSLETYPMRAKQVVAWADDIGTAGIEEATS